jgi:hypothetical protein
VISASFAQLQQQDTQIGSVYGNAKMWETMSAEQCAAKVVRNLRDCADQQRELIVDRVARRKNPLAAGVRWLLTIGALLWFPLVQPILEAILRDGFRQSISYSALLVVQVLGVSYLLKNVTFLIIYFLALWMMLRWDTQRRVDKLIRKIAAGKIKAAPSATSVAMEWMEELLQPLRSARELVDGLAQKEAQLRKQVA